MADIKVSSRAYTKIILHCAKYPHCAVNGVLLAENTKSKNSKNDDKLVIADAIPLFHICLHLSPMYEIALTQIDHMAASKGLVIAGYYLANENLNDNSPDVGHKIADKIAENFSSACLIVVDNKKFSTCFHDSLEPLINVFQNSDGKWKAKEQSSVEINSDTLQAPLSLFTRAQDVVDFDNHLDDISLDWWNLELNKLIDSYDST